MNITLKSFEQVVDNFKHEVVQGHNIKVNGIMVSQRQKTFTHQFVKQNKVELWSLTKPFLALLIGILIEERKVISGKIITLETKIWPLLKPFVKLKNTQNYKVLRDINLYHLLTHTAGFTESLMFSELTKEVKSNLADYIVNMDMSCRPGEHFRYTNAGGYIISIILQEHLHKPLNILINELLFKKIAVVDFSWNKIGKYCAGSTGLNLSIESIHKLGVIFCSDGKYKGTKIVSKKWVDKISSPQVCTPSMFDSSRVFPKYAYGFNMYICKDGTFYCDDKNGQYLIINRKDHCHITITAEQPITRSVTECLRPLLKDYVEVNTINV